MQTMQIHYAGEKCAVCCVGLTQEYVLYIAAEEMKQFLRANEQETEPVNENRRARAKCVRGIGDVNEDNLCVVVFIENMTLLIQFAQGSSG